MDHHQGIYDDVYSDAKAGKKKAKKPPKKTSIVAQYVQASSTTTCVALHDFDGTGIDNAMPLIKGDIVVVSDASNPDWQVSATSFFALIIRVQIPAVCVCVCVACVRERFGQGAVS